MDTGNNWRAPTLADAILTDDSLAEDIPGREIQCNGLKMTYRCYRCPTFKFPRDLVDVRTINDIPEDFICDGCCETLERNLTSVDGGTTTFDDPELLSSEPQKQLLRLENRVKWRAHFAKLLGAPTPIKTLNDTDVLTLTTLRGTL